MADDRAATRLRTPGIGRGAPVRSLSTRKEMRAFEGETVLAVLWAQGEHTLAHDGAHAANRADSFAAWGSASIAW